MRILAVVVIYHPDLNLLDQNLSKFCNDVEQTAVWDNTPKEDAGTNKQWLSVHYPKAVYMTAGENVGIGKALDAAFSYALDNKFDALLTMDDDSIFNGFREYRNRAMTEWTGHGESIISPMVNRHYDSQAEGYMEITDAITSGMLVPVSILKATDGYESRFFLEAIDVDLCYHARSLGYRVLADRQAILTQRYGKPSVRKILGRDIPYNDYTPKRLYGIFRNHVFLCRRYHWPRTLVRKIFRKYFVGLVMRSVMLGGKSPSKKLRATFKGIADGLRLDLR